MKPFLQAAAIPNGPPGNNTALLIGNGIKWEAVTIKLDEDFIYEVLSVVEEIPEGKVSTYGQIAALIGKEKNARQVGKVLSMSQYYGSYPCHRVVNHAGRTVPGWVEQRQLLEEEGVGFHTAGLVDLKRFLWEP